ncbi:DsbA family oxidoreductase [Ramlibacter monticola]|uniref:DsbA family oxidoreductase n=1 Tax=Ramlibacter monticola TaxID=1926872 RepID=A0A937CUV1_9BURK|nr:DsbA family oxidoreductase [Ramlibacter monticola]MBL0392357.1 DsbA family oxidoreductase [Ramlibacter monticola]
MPLDLRIDVYVELICPWCLIGKRNLARALQQLAASDPDVRVAVQWHAVQLIPQVPAEGWPFAEFYLKRLGSPEAVLARQAQVKAAAAQAGVEVDFARIARFPNTTLAHALLALAAQQPVGADAMLERLFAAYFQRGEDIGDRDTLLAVARELGVAADAARNALATANAPAPADGVSGVPLFVFDGQFSVSGAQPPEVLLSAIRHTVQARA